jgi:hypothetical protein
LTVALVKISLAATAMAMTATMIERGLSGVMPGTALTFQAIRVGLSIAGALAALATVAKVLRIREFDEMLALAEMRVRKLLTR